ncbi:MAG: metal-dependent transcriptional regulator [Deltaproteobacteria bacterium]|nr:metal-dependent transcriptional regulator [Deltaproteobacteria bacterium]
MRKTLEEILEAVWTDESTTSATFDEIRGRCPIPVTDELVEALERRHLVTREGQHVTLTYVGRGEARKVVRRHRLAKSLFASVLDLDAEKRETVACEAEHTLLPEVEEAICILLGHPTLCPDNKPIPPGRCCDSKRTLASSVIVCLTSLDPGERGRVTFVKAKDHARLHRLTAFGLTPGTIVQMHQRFPAYCIRFEGTELAINADAAEDIYVTKVG